MTISSLESLNMIIKGKVNYFISAFIELHMKEIYVNVINYKKENFQEM